MRNRMSGAVIVAVLALSTRVAQAVDCTATPTISGHAKITFNQPTGLIRWYNTTSGCLARIFWNPAGNPVGIGWAIRNQVPADAGGYAEYGMSPGFIYQFRVRQVNPTQASSQSPYSNLLTLVAPLIAPSLSSLSAQPNGVQLNVSIFAAASVLDRIEVLRRDAGAGNFSVVGAFAPASGAIALLDTSVPHTNQLREYIVRIVGKNGSPAVTASSAIKTITY